MYDFIEKDEYLSPQESLKKYLYFSGEDQLPRECEQILQIPLRNINVSDLHRNDFQELLRKSDLPEDKKKHYHTQFIRTKRIYKRQKAKMRFGSTHSSLAWLPVEIPVEHFVEDRIAEEHSTTKADSDVTQKDEDQKRKKRMSAQISRDRKKVYVEAIEAQNRELKMKANNLQTENQSLKKEIEALKCKQFPMGKTSIKSFFIMSLILLTSVNKHIHQLDTQLNFSQETLQKHATEILNEYSKSELKILLPQLEEFKKHFEQQVEMKQEAHTLMVPEAIINKPIIFGQEFQCRSFNTGLKKGTVNMSRRARGRHGKSLLTSEAA